jgi:hypothetical protein
MILSTGAYHGKRGVVWQERIGSKGPMSVDILVQLRYRGTFWLQKRCKEESGDAADDTLHWSIS